MTPRYPRFLVVLVAVVAGCRCSDPPATTPVEVLRVSRITAPLQIDGELDEADWTTAARTGPFIDGHGVEARPFSEAHFLWDDENLYVALYAADDDIRATVKAHDGAVWIDDSFSLELAPAGTSAPSYRFDISAMGVVTDVARDARGNNDPSWESGIVVHVDRDGTINDARDEDEEWVIEAAIPWRSMNIAAASGARFALDLGRCDTPRAAGSTRRCGRWSAVQGSSPQGRLLELAGGSPKGP